MRRLRLLLVGGLLVVALTGCLDEADGYSPATHAYSTPSSSVDHGTATFGWDMPTPTTEAAETFREGVWDSALLPPDFPSPTPTAEVLWTQYTPVRGNTAETWSLSLLLTAEQWGMLTDAFRAAGWAGGGTDALATRDLLLDGAWVGERHYAGVYRADYDAQSGLYTVEITVSPRTAPSTPETLRAWFPPFTDGYSATGCRADTSGDGIDTWIFGGSGRFCGVSETAVESYRRTLLDSGFTMGEPPQLPGFIGWSVEQSDGERLRRVEALYDPACCTLELIYTLAPLEA